MVGKCTISAHAPLVVEEHPGDYKGYPFITLIQYNGKSYLTLVDNATDKLVKCYILDLCVAENVNEELIINIASHWYEDNKDKYVYPLSVFFSRNRLSELTSKILRTFHIEFITRVIGPLPRFNITRPVTTKRRKRKDIKLLNL